MVSVLAAVEFVINKQRGLRGRFPQTPSLSPFAAGLWVVRENIGVEGASFFCLCIRSSQTKPCTRYGKDNLVRGSGSALFFAGRGRATDGH